MLPIFIEKDKPLSSDCWTSFICSYECCFWKLYKYFQTIFVHFFNLKVIIRELREDNKSENPNIENHCIFSDAYNSGHNFSYALKSNKMSRNKIQETISSFIFFLKSSNFRPFFFPVLMKKEIPYFLELCEDHLVISCKHFQLVEKLVSQCKQYSLV